MKILMVIDSLDRGGKERRMLELIKGLKKKGTDFDIYLVSLTDKVEYKYVYELPITFEVLKRKYKKDFTIVFKLRNIIRSFKPDIIHSWSTMASIYLSVANLFTGKPLINAVLADAPVHLNLSDKHYLRVKLTSPFSKVFVSNSKAGIISYKTPPKKSVCIYNGLDFNRFAQLRPVADITREILGTEKDDRFIIAMVASFSDRKDFKTLIKAAIKICARDPGIVFLLIGSGPTLESLQKIVPAEIKKQIIFTGKRDDVESIVQIIDAGSLITNAENHGEGISNSVIEYMALGKPVIATRGGGTNEVVIDNFNGFLVDPGSEEQIIESIGKLLNNKDLLRTLGQNAYQFVRENFDLEKKTVEYIALYQKLAPKTK